MPLDPLQDRIARTALALPQARTLALAGGGAMIAHGFVTRATKDIDLFTEIDDGEAIQVAAALREELHQQGLTTRDAQRPPADHRFVTLDPTSGAECTVEVFPDGDGYTAVSPSTSVQSCIPTTWPPTRCSRCGAGPGLGTSTTSPPCSTGTAPAGSSNWPRPLGSCRTRLTPSAS